MYKRQLHEQRLRLQEQIRENRRARHKMCIRDRIGHPLVGLVVDSTNSLSTEEPIDEVLQYMAPYCVCFHVKDYTCLLYTSPALSAMSSICCKRDTLEANVAMMIRWSLSVINFSSDLPTIFSLGV